MNLPVDSHRERICESFAKADLTILIAPPGTGKSTRVPRMLASTDQRVLCVEPRRIAARSLASRVASEIGESPGGFVGYRVRFDKRVSNKTRIEFVSRGVFLRQLLEDPDSLADYHAVLLDEFHERQLETDWIFGLLLSRRKSQHYPRIGILSATLNPDRIRELWAEARVVEVESPLHPVDLRHTAKPTQFDPQTVVERTKEAVLNLIASGSPPDYLVFLPGYREIRQTIRALREHPAMRGWDVIPLSGEQSPEEQDRAIQQGPRPKVIVATNLAESSLTVEGVRAVVDSGLARRMDHDPSRGINALRTVRVSRFSARQRTGRAGRIDQGVCVRLWSEREERDLSEEDLPECQRLDLSEWLLKTLGDDQTSPAEFPWIDPPPPENVEQARTLLNQLGALDSSGKLTARGRDFENLPLHPRMAGIILEGKLRGVASAAAFLVALVEEERLVLPDTSAEQEFSQRGDQADFEADFRLLKAMEAKYTPKHGQGIRVGAAFQVLQHARRLASNLPPSSADPEEERIRLRQCCLAGFPDRVARRMDRGTATYQCRDGSTVRLDRKSRVSGAEWILAIEKKELLVKGTRTSIFSSLVNLEFDWIENALAAEIHREVGVYEDPSGRLLQQEIRFLDSIEIERTTIGEAGESDRATYFAAEAVAGRIPLRKWNSAADQWICRVECLRTFFPELEIPPFDDEARQTVLEMVALETKTVKAFRNAEILPTLHDWLNPEYRPLLAEMTPEHYTIPGRKKPSAIDYQDPGAPRLSIRIQDAMRLKNHPKIAADRCPLTIELLAPNQRPVQVTQDLNAFWSTSYPSIRKDLRGRYPKHDWPESFRFE